MYVKSDGKNDTMGFNLTEVLASSGSGATDKIIDHVLIRYKTEITIASILAGGYMIFSIINLAFLSFKK